jgi:hypothetical protein
MLRIVFVAIFWATVVSVTMFSFFHPTPSPTVAFFAFVPHMPSRMLHYLYIGQYLDVPATYIADHLLHLLGSHTGVAAFLIVVLAVLPTASGRGERNEHEDAERGGSQRNGRIIFAALLCYPLCSALWSGIHISKLAQAAAGNAHSEGELEVIAPLLPFALMAGGELRVSRVMERMETIATAEPFTGPLVVGDSELNEQTQKINASLSTLNGITRERMNGVGKSAGKNFDEAHRALIVELAMRVQFRHLLFEATHDSGGVTSQPWRPVNGKGGLGLLVAGPAGSPMRLETNALPPIAAQHLLASKDDVSETRQKFLLGFKDQPIGLQQLLQSVHQPPLSDLPLDDALVMLWYNAASHYYLVKQILLHFLGSDAAPLLSSTDTDGELRIRLHNSKESYAKTVGATKDRAGRGVYDPRDNRIDVWEDERISRTAIARHHFRELARLFAEGSEDSKTRAKDAEAGFGADSLAAAKRAPLDKGATFVFSHELTHWAIHAMLVGALPDRKLPRCVDEGIAMQLDDMAWSVLPEQARAARLEDWATIWRDGADVTNTPGQTLELSDRDFDKLSATNAGALYADCFFAVRFFAVKVLNDALLEKRRIIDVVRLDKALSTPWSTIRSDVASGTFGSGRFRAPGH